MVKRICIQFPDGSLTITPRLENEQQELNMARDEARGFNRGEKNRSELAMVGEIEINLTSFKERT